MSQPSLLPTVTIVDGAPRVSSLDIAAHFGKRHERVLDAIRRIINDLEPKFNQHNFVLVKYADAKGESRPAYSLTRDAFSLVVMGFTGKAALAWKVRYIEAFNAMEARLAGQPVPVNMPAGSQKVAPPKPYCTDREMKPLDAAVDRWAAKTGNPRLKLLKKLRAHFGIARYNRRCPVQLFQHALEWVQEQMGEKPKLPKAEQKALPCATLPAIDAQTYESGERLFKAMANLNRDFGVVKDMVHLLGRPGSRLANLPPEKDALFSNAMDSINMALCALNLAQYGLRIATRIKATTDFNAR